MNTRIAGNAEQLLDAGLLETAKQEVANLHSSAGAAGHRFASLAVATAAIIAASKKRFT